MNEIADKLGKAYAFDGPALELGALVLEGEAHPEARIRKMGDNGFRPAYNAPFATDVDGGLIVDVEVVSPGTDNGLLLPCADRIARRYGVSPDAMLAAAGFQSVEDIEQLATEHRTRTYMPEERHRTSGPREEPIRAEEG